jgi:hypothetical protein
MNGFGRKYLLVSQKAYEAVSRVKGSIHKF